MKNKILRYALKNRKTANMNRKQVGKNLSILTVFLFFVFLINFAILIGSGRKFGVDLVAEAKKFTRFKKQYRLSGERFTIGTAMPLQKIQRLIISMPLLIKSINQLQVRFSM